ncbi:MAG: hypothetical protein CFE31_07955 [Rhizobiales bacterium PAR1]|nr:MAG: hypothetical protein CFE31_07955 [Rhizobiales bacterium PAR1]
MIRKARDLPHHCDISAQPFSFCHAFDGNSPDRTRNDAQAAKLLPHALPVEANPVIVADLMIA